MTFFANRARFDSEVAVAAPEVRDHQRRKEVPQRARPGGPAPARDDLAALAVRAVIVEVLLPHAADFLEPRDRRRVRRASPGRARNAIAAAARPDRSRCGRSASPGARRKKVNPASRRSSTRPASFSSPRWRETPDWAIPRIEVSSVTFRRSASSSRRMRSRASSPSSRKRPAESISINLHALMPVVQCPGADRIYSWGSGIPAGPFFSTGSR